jgi:hypothetical protein
MMMLRLNPRSLRTAIFYPLIAVFAAVQLASGVDLSTYTTVNDDGEIPATWHRSWMSALPDSMLISELSIPGTHDSGCIDKEGDATSLIADCQDAKIIDQLNAGVRFLDLRVEDTNGPWQIYHDAFQYQTLLEVLIEIATFLSDHPRETVLVRITVFGSDHKAFLFQWPWKFAEPFKDFIWQRKGRFRADGVTPTTYAHEAKEGKVDNFYQFGSYNWPTLGEVRGKMVLFLNPDPLIAEGKGHASGLSYANNKTDPPTPTDGSSIFQIINRDRYGHTNTDEKLLADLSSIFGASIDPNRKALWVTGINIGAARVCFKTI